MLGDYYNPVSHLRLSGMSRVTSKLPLTRVLLQRTVLLQADSRQKGVCVCILERKGRLPGVSLGKAL